MKTSLEFLNDLKSLLIAIEIGENASLYALISSQEFIIGSSLNEFRKRSIGQSYGVSESTAYKTAKWAEGTLIKHPDFALPGRKELLKSDVEYEVVLIDATETPIERPKKDKRTSTPAKRRGTL